MIKEKYLRGFENKMENGKTNYPTCRCGNCPNTYFNLLAISPRQTGKTYSIVKLLRHYEENDLLDNEKNKHPMRIILISPTIDANPIYKSLKTLNDDDKYDIYTDDLLEDIINDIKMKKEETMNYKDYVKAYKIVEQCPENKLPLLYDKYPDIFNILEKEDYKTPNEIRQPTYKETCVNFVILDDLLASSDAFNNKKQGKLLNSIIKNRHMSINFIIASQSMKGLPKTIRLNSSLFYLGKFSNLKTIEDDIYEEVSNLMTLNEFINLYNHATKEQYGALVIDSTGKGKKLLKGWDTELMMN